MLQLDDDYLDKFNNYIKTKWVICVDILLLVYLKLKDTLNAMFSIFLYCLIKLNRKRVIMDGSGKNPYLERYYLLFRDRKDFPFNIFLHKYIKSDCKFIYDENVLYDHPWDYFILILSGSCLEYVFENKPKLSTINSDTKLYNYQKIIKYRRNPGFFQFKYASDSHRIEIDDSKNTCWTLCIPFKRKGAWGFWKYNDDIDSKIQWINSKKYLKDKTEKTLNEELPSVLHDNIQNIDDL